MVMRVRYQSFDRSYMVCAGTTTPEVEISASDRKPRMLFQVKTTSSQKCLAGTSR